MSEWKLYVFENVLTDYTAGMAFAVARNVEEAIKVCCPYRDHHDSFQRNVTHVHQLKGLKRKKPFGYYVYGGG